MPSVLHVALFQDMHAHSIPVLPDTHGSHGGVSLPTIPEHMPNSNYSFRALLSLPSNPPPRTVQSRDIVQVVNALHQSLLYPSSLLRTLQRTSQNQGHLTSSYESQELPDRTVQNYNSTAALEVFSQP